MKDAETNIENIGLKDKVINVNCENNSNTWKNKNTNEFRLNYDYLVFHRWWLDTIYIHHRFLIHLKLMDEICPLL